MNITDGGYVNESVPSDLVPTGVFGHVEVIQYMIASLFFSANVRFQEQEQWECGTRIAPPRGHQRRQRYPVW